MASGGFLLLGRAEGIDPPETDNDPPKPDAREERD
jgi:hypothetical protein